MTKILITEMDQYWRW